MREAIYSVKFHQLLWTSHNTSTYIDCRSWECAKFAVLTQEKLNHVKQTLIRGKIGA